MSCCFCGRFIQCPMPEAHSIHIFVYSLPAQLMRKNVGLVRLPRTHVHCFRNAGTQCFRFLGEFSIDPPSSRQVCTFHKFEINFSNSPFLLFSAKTTMSHIHWTTYATWRINCVIQLNFYMTIVLHTQT